MENWQDGNSDTFEQLFRQYEKIVFRTAYLITGSKEHAEDIVQNVFLSVWRSRSSYDPAKGKFTTWLHRIVVNECSHCFQNSKLNQISLDDCEEMATLEPQPEEVLLGQEERSLLINVIGTMEQKYRTILVLHYFNELTCLDIANLLDVPVGTVKWRLHQALIIARSKVSQQLSLMKGEQS